MLARINTPCFKATSQSPFILLQEATMARKKPPPGFFDEWHIPLWNPFKKKYLVGKKLPDVVANDNKPLDRWDEAFKCNGIDFPEINTAMKRIPKLRNKVKKIKAAQVSLKRRYRWRQEELPRRADRSKHSARLFGRGLLRRGFVAIGHGAFSDVYAKPNSDRVLKVCRNPDNWIDYMAWANKAGYGGKDAPKIFSFKYYDGKDGKFYVAVMERLEKTLSGLKGKEDCAFFHNLVDSAISNDNEKAYQCMDLIQLGASDFYKKFKLQFGGKEYKGYGRQFDLHGGNFMVRKDGTAVLVDPLCGNSKLKAKRLRVGDLSPALAALLKITVDKCLV
jgi:hypothetical protein